MLADAAGRPLASWQALKDAMTGTGAEAEAALADAAGSARCAGRRNWTTPPVRRWRWGGRARRRGGGGRGRGTALTGWAGRHRSARRLCRQGARHRRRYRQRAGRGLHLAENAVADFVKTGKLDFRDLVTSMIADLAKLAARRFILGPIANALSGALGGAGGIFANILHAGGMVGAPGPGRMVPALAFANAPRMHSGGWAGLRPTRFRRSCNAASGFCRAARRLATAKGQRAHRQRHHHGARRRKLPAIAHAGRSDIARAVSLGRRGM
jgi:hypothetical protein